jgi:hypothetical protein
MEAAESFKIMVICHITGCCIPEDGNLQQEYGFFAEIILL